MQNSVKNAALENNIILWGWHQRFTAVYEMMKMPTFWEKEYFYENLGGWFGSSISSFKDIRYAYHNYQWIKSILRENNVNTIYLGEILNQSYRFTSVVFHKKGYKIAFFEEGTSHYVNRPYKESHSIKTRVKQLLLDSCYFLPLYGVRFAKWHSTPNRPYEELPIDRRYSIIPFHHEVFDVRLNIEPIFPEKLKEYVLSNIKTEDGMHRVMLMTDPLWELMPKDYLYLYFDTISECIESISTEQFLYIKFHPREIESSRCRILDIAEKSGLHYKVLSDEVNICVEYYLQMFYFEKIFFFNAATFFYNGYAFPHMKFVKLMPIIYRKSQEVGLKKLTYMEKILNMIELM